MYEPLSVELVREEGRPRLVVGGELDLASVPQLEAALPAPAPGETLVVDLRELAFIDSSGIHVLMGLDTDARARGWSLVVVRAGADVQRILDLCHLGERVRLVDSPDDV